MSRKAAQQRLQSCKQVSVPRVPQVAAQANSRGMSPCCGRFDSKQRVHRLNDDQNVLVPRSTERVSSETLAESESAHNSVKVLTSSRSVNFQAQPHGARKVINSLDFFCRWSRNVWHGHRQFTREHHRRERFPHLAI